MALPPILAAPNVTARARRLMELTHDRVLVFDGAMGTQTHALDLPPEAYDGIPDCPEILNLSQPDAIASIHRRYYEAGADIVETNSFGSSSLTLAEFGLEDRAEEISMAAASIARGVADELSSREPDKPRFVSGSIGPGTKLPTLGHISFAELCDALTEQTRGLLRGGCDLIQIETCQDVSQMKAAVVACQRAFAELDLRVPVLLQMTVETMGTLLLGTEVTAAFATFECYDEVWGFGLNCATGPTFMGPHLKTLSELSDRALSCLPNAGLPENIDGQVVYKLGPEQFAEEVAAYTRELGLNLVGGCCGTTPEHIAALAAAVSGIEPRPREGSFEPSAASLYSSTTLAQIPPPLLVGERLNANGSKRFRKLLLSEDYDGMVAMAKSQMQGGAHLLDVCVAYVARDERRDMQELLSRLRGQSQLPLVIDSTEVPVIEAALELIPGRAVVNSINLEDGEERARAVLELCQKHGAAVIALTIDEEGQAYTADRKLAIAERIFALAIEHGLRPQDIIFDALTFTLATGDEQYRKVGIETLEGIRRIKERCAGCFTILGLSNCSFGLNPAARQVLNSVFLDEAVKVGLDQAIVHAAKILPLFRIGEEEQRAARDLIYDRREQDDPLHRLMALFADRKATGSEAKVRPDTIEEVLSQRIVEGDRKGLTEDLDEALESYGPFEIINGFLLDGMKLVGELFGAGKMQLPFVLQSAEVMKAAVKHLEPHMDKLDSSSRGKVLLATVKGDVHDIGKNLVDIILSNNGFTVRNLGIKQPIEAIINAAEELGADVVGLSGLLVKSTVVMRDNLAELNRRGLTHLRILLGGAALTRSYVEQNLRELYRGEVAYASDAFDGLSLVTRVVEQGSLIDPDEAASSSDGKAQATPKVAAPRKARAAPKLALVPPPAPPFWGARQVDAPIAVDELLGWINKKTLFRGQWQFRRGDRDRAAQMQHEREVVEPIFAEVSSEAIERGILQPRVAYGWFPCRRDGDSLVLYHDPDARDERARLSFPRQHPDQGGRCLSDYFRADVTDVLGLSAVTVGAEASAFTKSLFEADDYTRYLYFHGLAVEAAEGLAEYWHRQMRVELGIAGDDSEDRTALFRQEYRGRRYSFGYPACPDLSLQTVLFDLIPAAAIGLELTEEHQLVPEQSTTAVMIHHPEARYFGA
jgi:5-methyltetrahydrofolate--homocysteine methyltransferase